MRHDGARPWRRFAEPILRRALTVLGHDSRREGCAVVGEYHSGGIELLDTFEPFGPGGDGSAEFVGSPAGEVGARVRGRATAHRCRHRRRDVHRLACDEECAVSSSNDEGLVARAVAGGGQHDEAVGEFDFAIDPVVGRAVEVDKFREGVVGFECGFELCCLDDNAPAFLAGMPPQWSKCRWLLTTMSIPYPASLQARSRRRRCGW